MSGSTDFMTKRHKFIYECATCKTKISIIGDSGTVISPGATHGEATRNGMSEYGQERTRGAQRIASMSKDSNEICGGFGRMVFVRSETYEPPPPPATTPDGWNVFAARVDGFWQAFKAGGFHPSQRGVNNRGSADYQAIPEKIRTYLRDHPTVNIAGGSYDVSDSHSGGVSLHRPIPQANCTPTMKSFIYHL